MFQDMCQYKSDKIIQKSMRLLFMLYSERTDLMGRAAQAQVCII